MGSNFSNLVCLQWGRTVNITKNSYTVYLPISFTTTAYSVVICDWASPSDSPYAASIGVFPDTFGISTFVVYCEIGYIRGSVWIAIGY